MLIIHIGRHKTGTSSIQHFLHANRQELLKRGFIYPEPIGGAAAHHGIALALAKGDDVTGYREMVQDLLPRKNNVLLSSEGFQRPPAKSVRKLTRGFPTRAIGYLREQFSYAWAAYAQKVAAGNETRTFDEALSSYVPRYYAFLDRWRAITKGDLKVRIFDRKQLVGGDVVIDFLTILGLKPEDFPPAGLVDESFGWRSVVFLRRFNKCIEADPELAQIKPALLRAIRGIGAGNPELLEKPTFPDSMIKDYQTKFTDENQRISAEFFDGRQLFDLSWDGQSAFDQHARLERKHVEALYESLPTLRTHSAVIELAAMV